MNLRQLALSLAVVSMAAVATGSKILVLLPMVSKSHKTPVIPLMEELSKRNHTITQITNFRSGSDIPGVETIYLEAANKMFEALSANAFNMSSLSWSQLFKMGETIRGCCEVIYNDTSMQQFMKNPGHYDAILVSSALNECTMALATQLGAPLVMVSPSALVSYVAWDLDIPTPWSYVPFIASPNPSRMTFLQRLNNAIWHLSFSAMRNFFIGPQIDSVVRKYIPNAASSLDNSNVSMILVNSHHSLDAPRPGMPYAVDVGGMHCRPAETIPPEFESFIEGAGEHGFIVFSMGSILQGKSFPEPLVDAFKTAFAKLKQRIIWKFEIPIEGLSANVMISKWIPQQDLMGHPKCRLAITHGGLLSLQEVAYHEVPLLGVPIGADRDINIQHAVDKGFAEVIDWKTATSDIILEKIQQLLTNKKYKENASKISALMKDRPQPPGQTAAYWVEYVIRHKGTQHMKSAARNLNFFQYFLLDVIAVVSASLLSVLALIAFLLCKTVKYCRRGKAHQKSTVISKKQPKTKLN